MVPSLYSLSIEASLQDLRNLKRKIYVVPRMILYDLVRYCVSAKPKKTLAFQTLFQNWPFDTFSLQSIGITFDEGDIVLVLFAVQKCQFGSIKHLDLVQIEHVPIKSKHYIKLLLHNSPLLNTDRYGRITDPCDNDVEYAKYLVEKEKRINASLPYQHGAKYAEVKKKFEKLVSLSNGHANDEDDNATKVKKEITIYADLFVYELEIINVLANEVYENNNVLIKLIPVRITFGDFPSEHIASVLDSISNTGNLRSLDLRFVNLKICEDNGGLSSITESICKFSNLENVDIAYNRLGGTGCQLFVDCLKQLSKLKRLDLSRNGFGGILCDFFNSDLPKYLTELKLAGCKVRKPVLDAMADCKCLSNLDTLKLADNGSIGCHKDALKNFLEKYKATLKHLDVSNCGLSNEDVSDIRLIINDTVGFNRGKRKPKKELRGKNRVNFKAK